MRLAALELSAAQYIVIATLATGEERMSAADLCKGIPYDAGAMTRMLDRLEAKNLISRERCTHDRRLTYLQLTDEGRALLVAMEASARRAHSDTLSSLGEAEQAQFVAMMKRIAAAHEDRHAGGPLVEI